MPNWLRHWSRKPEPCKGCASSSLAPTANSDTTSFFASLRLRRGSASASILNGFLKSKTSFWFRIWKFEPNFLKKSRFSSKFLLFAKIPAYFTSLMNQIAGSNQLSFFCSKSINLSFRSCFCSTKLFLFC